MNGKEAIKMLRTIQETVYLGSYKFYEAIDVAIKTLEQPTIEPEPHWIPFKRRKPTEEEVTAFDYIMDCKCPEDGQNILVSINIQGHEPVQYDTFYGGGGEECCLESGYELVEEAVAWMPLPEPYAERRTDD